MHDNSAATVINSNTAASQDAQCFHIGFRPGLSAGVALWRKCNASHTWDSGMGRQILVVTLLVQDYSRSSLSAKTEAELSCYGLPAFGGVSDWLTPAKKWSCPTICYSNKRFDFMVR
jgi:hypothetical protein